MTDPFAGRTSISAEEYRAYLDSGALCMPSVEDLPPPDWQTSEKAFMAKVVRFAIAHGWDVPYHTFESAHSAPGFPDLVFKRGGKVRRVAELKVGGKKPTKDQLAWLDAFAAAGIPADVWTPADWPVIEEVLG